MKHLNIFVLFLIATGLISFLGFITYDTVLIISAMFLLGKEVCDIISPVHNRN